MLNLEAVARQICRADHHTPWPSDDYNGRAQRRHYMKLAEAANLEITEQLLSHEGMLEGTIAAVESDSGPQGSALFDIHWTEFATGYANTLRATIKRMMEV